MADVRTWHDGRRYHEKVDASSSGSVAHEGDVVRIAVKIADILLNPVQGRDLVHEAVVGYPRFLIRLRVDV